MCSRRPRLRSLCLAPLLALACSSTPATAPRSSAPTPPRAELVLVGGKIHGSDATAVAVKGGRILQIGTDAEVLATAGPETKVIGLGGKFVLPGLADSHAHLRGLGMRRAGVDLVGTNSVEEVRGKVRQAVQAARPGEWILGRGWDQNDWEAYRKRGQKFPTAAELDDVSPANPVVLVRIDGHALWANAKAMELAGVSPQTKTPSGGEIVRGKGGRPAGVFVDNAMGLIQEKSPAPTREQVKKALLLAQSECLAAGLVQVHDMGVGADELAVLRELEQSGELTLRVYAMLDGGVEDLAALMGAGPQIAMEPEGRLTVRGVKFFIDGALGSRGALLAEPYNDDKKLVVKPVTPPEILEARVRTAKERGFQVATHAIGDKGNRVVLDLYERVFSDGLRAARARVEHAQILDPADIPRFGRLGVIASMQPTHATSDMPWVEARIGKARMKGAYAWRSLLSTSATIAAGSDAPVEDISPMLGLYAAITRKDMFGSPEKGWLPEERMSAEQAVQAFTRGAAYASFREAEAGRLERGFVADLTVLGKDPALASEEELTGIQAELTVIAGRVVFAKAGADAPPEPAKIEAAPKAATSTTTTSTRTGQGP